MADKRSAGQKDASGTWLVISESVAEPETTWKHRCGAMVRIGVIAHPLWFRETTAGLGKCRYEDVPYCPECETEPVFHGAPEYYDVGLEGLFEQLAREQATDR